MRIAYRADARPPVEAICQLYQSAGLNRPTQNTERVAKFYEHSPVVFTAWNGPQLVGIVRGWTDHAYDGYVCDLAVHKDFQKQNIGRTLLKNVIDAHSSDVQWILRAAPLAADYYGHIGWQKFENGWIWPRKAWR